MNHDAILKIVQPLLECPTAPMFESAVREEIQRQLSDIPGLTLQVDPHGNLIAWCGKVLAVKQRVRRARHQLFEQGFAFQKRPRPEIDAVEM